MSVKECGEYGLCVRFGASNAIQCDVSENGEDGVAVFDGSKGIFTDCTFHHNRNNGVWTWADVEGTLVELMVNKRRFTTTEELASMHPPMAPLTFTFHHDPSLLWFMTTTMISSQTAVAKFNHNSLRHHWS